MREEKTPAVYILASQRNGTLYIGVTSALWNRIADHKNGRFKGFSSTYATTLLVWYEHHPSMPSAIHREARLKKWKRAWKLELIEAFNPHWCDLHEMIDSNLNWVEEFATRKVMRD